MMCLFIATLTLISVISVLANELSPAQDSFLEKQDEFNKAVYAHYSENAQYIRKGGFSRANFAAIDATQSDLQNLTKLIEKRKIKVQVICRNTAAASCAEKILAKDPSVQPTIVIAPFMQHIETMKSIPIENAAVAERWKSHLNQMQLLVKEHLGNDFVEHLIGYSDSINMYSFILISKDRTKVIVLTGDAN